MVGINVIGRLGANAEVLDGKNGKFVTFRLAVDDWKDGKKFTSWFKVNFNGERALKLIEYLTKGKLVNVIGTESVGTYQSTKDGSTQISRDINAYTVEFVSVGSGSTSSEASSQADKKVEELTTGQFKKEATVVAAASSESSSDDDLPF